MNDTVGSVKKYYGEILESKDDLQTSACCSIQEPPQYIRNIIKNINGEILEKFYGCGSPVPPALEGAVVLDLGCGTGRDVYIFSSLVGAEGKVIGVDMTDEQLDVACRHVDFQTSKFGYDKPNVSFVNSYIEELGQAGIESDSIDVVTSNCVINLSGDKKKVFSEIFRVLKPGGELFFSDVFADRRIPDELRTDPVIYGECLGGALYVEDFRRILQSFGCHDYRIVSKRKITIDNPKLEEKLGMIDFYSMTIRAFKLDDLEDICEDYGQVATYKGTLPNFPHSFPLDSGHTFLAGKPALVCGNTASMLEKTRYSKYFDILGDRSRHHGQFDCGSAASEYLEKPSCC